MIFKRNISYFLIFSFILQAYSLSQEFGWKLYSEKEGLPHDQISTIYQSYDGYIWVGTYVGGLGRYSSSGWKYYKSSDEIPSNWITCITQDKKTNIYFVGTIAGLIQIKNKPVNISRGTVIENQDITALCLIDNSNLLVGTLTGLYKFDFVENKVIKLKDLWVTSIKQLNEKEYIFADKSGLFLYNNSTNKIIKYPLDLKSFFPINDVYGNFYINSIYREGDNHIWIGTSYNRVFEIENSKITEYIIAQPSNIINKVNDICKDIDGFLWIATDRGLYFIYNNSVHSVQKSELNKKYISSLLLDYENTLWVGTNNGLWKLPKKTFISFGNDINEQDNNCYQILEVNPNEFLVGTLKGLLKLEIKNSFYEKAQSKLILPSSFKGIDFTEYKFLSVVNSRGNIYTNDKHSSTSYLLKNDKLTPFTKYNGDLIYTDDKSNILTYKRNIGAVLIYSQSKVDTIYLEKEKKIELNSINFFKDEIYICTINGIYVVKNNKIIDHITTKEGLSSNSVQSIYIDKNKNFWCATENGLSLYDNDTKRWFVLNTTNGLLNNFIYWVFEDGRNYIWIGTPQGVNKIIDKDRFLAAIRTSFSELSKYIKEYTTIDGLGNIDCNQNGFLVDSKGRVWINTVDKINLYLEQFDRSQLIPPKVTLSKIEIDNKELNLDSLPVFTSGIDLITFYFAGNSFVDETSIKYKYFLEGYENNYSNPTYLAFAQYHNIPPGEYVFHLKAISKTGIESVNEIAIKFKVKARFYQTMFFKVLVALMGFALVIHLTINYQKRKTRKKLEMLEREKLFSDQKRKLAEMTLEHERERMEKDKLETEMKLKRDFTAMLIHELRSPLSSINGYAKLIKELGNLNADQSNAIDLILKLDERMLNIVNQMLDLSKFEAGKMEIEKVNMDIISLIDETIDSFVPLLKSKNLSLVKSYHQKECWINLDILKIVQVLTNIISNAIKFSPENGTITISTSIKDNFVCFSCTDEGPGIKKADINNVFDLYKQVQKGIKGTGLGLSISKLIIEAHNGKIYCESEEGRGATFSFCLPLD